MRLYFSPLSANARRVRLAAIQLGVTLEEVYVDLPGREHRGPAYLKLNAMGRVPVLDDEGFLLTESQAIMQYLADKVGSDALYPKEIRARADVNRWMFFCAHHFAPAVGVLNWERVVKKIVGGEPDPKEEARGERLFAECAQVLNAHLEGKQWLSQDRLTLADLSLATPLMSTVPARLPVAEYPAIVAWHARIQELPAWQKTQPQRP